MDLFQFIVTNVFLISAGAVLYLFARTLPRVEFESDAEKKGLFERWIKSGMPERIDAAMNGFLFKTLKKLRVLLLRFDNTIGDRIKKMQSDTHTAKKEKHLNFAGMATPEQATDKEPGENNLANEEDLGDNL